jgi:hypothetical protein
MNNSELPIPSKDVPALREKIEANLQRTGDWQGRTPDELSARHEETDMLRDEPSAKQRVLAVYPKAEMMHVPQPMDGDRVRVYIPLSGWHMSDIWTGFGGQAAWEDAASKLSPVPPSPEVVKNYGWQVRRIERYGVLTQTIVMSEEAKARKLYRNWCQNREWFGDELISLVRFEEVTIESSGEGSREQG